MVDIEDCIQLKKEIEDLVQHGYLEKYIREGVRLNARNPNQLQTQAEIDN